MVVLYVIILFAVVILLNVLIFKLLIKRALRKFIRPKLENECLIFIDYKWAGFFSFGNFKNEEIVIRPSGSDPFLTIYIYIYFKDTRSEKRITAKIDTLFLFIRKVTYSSGFSSENATPDTTTD